MRLPEFTAEKSLVAVAKVDRPPSRQTQFGRDNQMIPAVPIPYRVTECGWEV